MTTTMTIKTPSMFNDMNKIINKIGFLALIIFFLAGGFYAGAKKQRIEIIAFEPKKNDFLENKSASAAEPEQIDQGGERPKDHLPVAGNAEAVGSSSVSQPAPEPKKPAEKNEAAVKKPATVPKLPAVIPPAEKIPAADPVPTQPIVETPPPVAPIPAPEPVTAVS